MFGVKCEPSLTLLWQLRSRTHYKLLGLNEPTFPCDQNWMDVYLLSSPLPSRWGNHTSAKDGLLSLPRIPAPGFSSKSAFSTRALGDLWGSWPGGEGRNLGRIQSVDWSCWPSRDWDWIIHLPTLSRRWSVWALWVLTLRISSIWFLLQHFMNNSLPSKDTEADCSKVVQHLVCSH